MKISKVYNKYIVIKYCIGLLEDQKMAQFLQNIIVI